MKRKQTQNDLDMIDALKARITRHRKYIDIKRIQLDGIQSDIDDLMKIIQESNIMLKELGYKGYV